MRKILLTTLLIISFFAFMLPPTINYSRVYTLNGVDAYIMAEPVRKYEIVLGKDKPINMVSLLTGGLVNNNIKTKVSALTNGLLKKAEEENVKIDAIIYTSGKSITGIKYTDEETEDNKRKAEVQKLSGIPVYIMSDPWVDYKVVSDEGGGIKWKSLVTGGLVNNSIEEDVQKFVKKFEKQFEKGKIDAIMYNGGSDAEGIKFQ